MHYYIDVDGVVRRFLEQICPGITNSWCKIPDYIWEELDLNPKKYLYDCGVYSAMIKYVKEEIGLENCTFLTNQMGVKIREYWTEKFIKLHFGDDAEVIFTSTFQEKVDLLLLNPSSTLIDDYPFYPEKEGWEEVALQIVLMERNWNRNQRKDYIFTLRVNEEEI